MSFPTTHPALARALAAREYSVPTAVQLAVLQGDAAGRDLLVSAQTGSGKTVAFGLAFATKLLGEAERFDRAAEPMALVIAPTRELAMQVQRELSWLYAETGARVVACVGGMDVRAEARQLQAGAHIVVGTPGRLRDHLERKRLDLSQLKTIVLDEADEMLDLGFREDLEYILDATPDSRQTLLFSATMPREIEVLAKRYQSEAIRIETLRRDEQHADIEYNAIRVAPNDVEHAVVNVLRFHEMRATLVFCSTREAVRRLHARLVERGFSAVALSGELTQHERTTALQSLRDGRSRVLVATDVAARGLDLPDLALVIHADLPNDRETLLHRSGRTGRAGRKGICTLIVPYNRRRKAEVLLSAAKLKVTWGTAPTGEQIRAKDQERFLADAVFTDAATDEDVTLATALQSARTADEIALALVRMNRARLPAPEDLAEDTGPPRRDSAFKTRDEGLRPARDRFERPERSGERSPRPPRAPRDDNREMVWFRLNIGRDRNADPRWLIPLICKAGGITKAEIGSIKIFDKDTRFQIVAELADQFADSARTNKTKEGHISRANAHEPADTAARSEQRTAPAKVDADPSFVAKAPIEPKPSFEPKKSWRDRVKPDAAPRHERTTPADAKRTEPEHRPFQKAKAPWHERVKPAGGGGRFKDGPKSSSSADPRHGGGDARPYSKSKAPWKDKDKAKSGGYPPRKHEATPAAPPAAKRPTLHVAGSRNEGSAVRLASRFDSKKKHRKGAPLPKT